MDTANYIVAEHLQNPSTRLKLQIALGLCAAVMAALVVLTFGKAPALLLLRRYVQPTLEAFCASVLVTAPVVFSLGLQCSGMAAVYKIKQDRCTGDLSPVTFVALVANSGVWCAYAALIRDATCFVPNFTGLLFGLYYLYVFARNTITDMRPYYLFTATTLGAVGGAALVFGSAAAPCIGLVGAGACFALLSSPLATVKTVFATKSTSSMTFAICFASFWNSLSWLMYGVVMAENPLIYVPNGFGLIACVVQLALFALFPAKPRLADQLEEAEDLVYSNIGKTA